MPQKRRYAVIMQFGNRPAAFRTVTMAETPGIAMNRMAFGWTFCPDREDLVCHKYAKLLAGKCVK